MKPALVFAAILFGLTVPAVAAEKARNAKTWEDLTSASEFPKAGPVTSWAFYMSLKDAVPVLELTNDGRVLWRGREISKDEELVSALRDVVMGRTCK